MWGVVVQDSLLARVILYKLGTKVLNHRLRVKKCTVYTNIDPVAMVTCV